MWPFWDLCLCCDVSFPGILFSSFSLIKLMHTFQDITKLLLSFENSLLIFRSAGLPQCNRKVCCVILHLSIHAFFCELLDSRSCVWTTVLSPKPSRDSRYICWMNGHVREDSLKTVPGSLISFPHSPRLQVSLSAPSQFKGLTDVKKLWPLLAFPGDVVAKEKEACFLTGSQLRL